MPPPFRFVTVKAVNAVRYMSRFGDKPLAWFKKARGRILCAILANVYEFPRVRVVHQRTAPHAYEHLLYHSRTPLSSMMSLSGRDNGVKIFAAAERIRLSTSLAF